MNKELEIRLKKLSKRVTKDSDAVADLVKQINLNTDTFCKEILELENRLDKLDNNSSIKTIAKHVQELEEKVDGLENYIYASASPMTGTVQIFAINERDGKYSVGEEVYPKPKPDYFLKAKNLLIEYAEKTMIKKGIEYTPIGDRFANFRPILGEKATAIEKLIGYNAKHVQYCFMQETNITAKTIDELLEHWGDVFNYNVLGLAMQSTDKPNSVVPYADRPTQEKEIKDIVDSAKNFTEYNSKLTNNELYSQLLGCIKESNLNYIIYLFAKQLERLEGK